MEKYFEYLIPLLIVTWLIIKIACLTKTIDLMGQYGKPLIIIFSAFITLYPFTGLSLAEYLLSLNPSYSIGSMVFFFIIVWNEFGLRPILSHMHLFQLSLWNVIISLLLFASTLGFIGFDLYALGYQFSAVFLVIAFFTILLVLLGNRLSYIFMLYIASFNMKLLRSDNFFDYITDGVIFFISLGIIILSIVKYKLIFNRKPYVFRFDSKP